MHKGNNSTFTNMEKITKGKRTTIAVTSDFRGLFDDLKNKGYNFATVSANAIRAAINSRMDVPPRDTPKGYIPDEEKENVGVLVPHDVAERLDKLTKPTGSKQAYIREAVKQYVANNNLL